LTHSLQGHFEEAGTFAAWHVHLKMLASALSGSPSTAFASEHFKELAAAYSGAIRHGA
jgi:hypothetical protein